MRSNSSLRSLGRGYTPRKERKMVRTDIRHKKTCQANLTGFL